MRRILNAWPYLAVVVAGYAAFWALLLSWSACSDVEAAGGSCVLRSIDFKSLAVAYLYGVVPVASFATGAVLGYRRGYDVVAVLATLGLWLAIPEPVTGQGGVLTLYWGNKLWFPLIAIAVIGHFGILVGIGIGRLVTRRDVPASVPRPLSRVAPQREGAGMRAVQYSSYGGPDVLGIVELPEPQAGPGQVRIRVQAAGVNPYDAKLRSGAFAGGRQLARPVVPGLEAAGIVDQVGEGVSGTAIGDPVFGFTVGGASADLAILQAWAPQPGGDLSPTQAAGLPVVAETATRVVDLLGIGEADRVLVHGAAGAVGQGIVQLAVLRGARVVGTARPANHELLTALGALPTEYGPGMVERVRALLPSGPTLVADTAGSQLDDLLALAPGPAAIVTIANFAAGEHGVRVTSERGDAVAALTRVAGLAAAGRFRVQVSHTFPLAEAAAAHRLSESRSAGGKIVLVA